MIKTDNFSEFDFTKDKSFLTPIAAVILAEFTERDIGVKRELQILKMPERFVTEQDSDCLESEKNLKRVQIKVQIKKNPDFIVENESGFDIVYTKII